MTDTIEFTDRYGGRAPSWLRGCHDQCEAMGAIPEDTHVEGDVCSLDDPDCDGWHFVKCLSCGGSGRVSWFVTVARVPRWIVKGIRFYRWAMTPSISPEGWTWRMRFKNYLNAAFISDLRRLRR